MSAAEVQRMAVEAFCHRRPWDGQASDRPVSDVDEGELRSFVERGNACGRIGFPFAGVEETLEGLGLMRGGRLLNAAEALFCPSRGVGLKMGILATHARTEILDLHQERGAVFQLARRAQLYILTNTRRRFVIDGPGPREEVPELPPDAVREAVINAFAHRDWTSSASVQVEIYNDSVEVFSPGWFVEGQDPYDHLSGVSRSSLTRNPLIAQTLYKSGDIESFASGIPRIRDLCAAAGIGIEYVRMADGTNFVFHRRDAFAAGPSPTPSGALPDSNGSCQILAESSSVLSGFSPDSNGSCRNAAGSAAPPEPPADPAKGPCGEQKPPLSRRGGAGQARARLPGGARSLQGGRHVLRPRDPQEDPEERPGAAQRRRGRGFGKAHQGSPLPPRRRLGGLRVRRGPSSGRSAPAPSGTLHDISFCINATSPALPARRSPGRKRPPTCWGPGSASLGRLGCGGGAGAELGWDRGVLGLPRDHAPSCAIPGQKAHDHSRSRIIRRPSNPMEVQVLSPAPSG